MNRNRLLSLAIVFAALLIMSCGGGGGSSTDTGGSQTGTNHLPIAVGDTVSTTFQASVDIDVTANDSDPDGDLFAVTSVTTPAHGTAERLPTGTVRYTPAAGYSGGDSFTYTITDTNGGAASATVSLTIAPNQPPVALDDTASTQFSTPVDIEVLANDSDPDGGTLSVSAFTQGSGGSVADTGSGLLRYTPSAGFEGADQFTYTLIDSQGGADSATVTVTTGAEPNRAPVAANDIADARFSTPLLIDVLANDSDPDGDALSITSASTPQHGAAALSQKSSAKTIQSTADSQGRRVLYTPATGYSGIDTFTYYISDGKGGTAHAGVTVTVAANQPPDAVNDAAVTPTEVAVELNVLTNDSDPDGGTLSVTSTTNGSHGTAQTLGSGIVRYTPAGGFSGTDQFTYSISDSQGGSDTATVTVVVTAVNIAPVAANDSATTPEGSAVDVDVLANDTDANGDALSVSSFSQGTHGAVTDMGGGALRYTPATGYVGADQFAYSISDGQGGQDDATVTVTVTALNHAPVAQDDTGLAQASGSVVVSVLANDTDADGDALSVSSFTQGAYGTVADMGAGVFRYTHSGGAHTSDTFTYTATDGNGGTDTATVTLTINQPPIAEDLFKTTPGGGDPITFNGLEGASDPDGGTLSIKSVGAAGHGMSAHVSGSTVYYKPTAGYVGPDSFTLTIEDGQGGTVTRTVNVTIPW